MEEEAFVFEPFRLIPAQRMLLENGKPLHPAAGPWLS
jgi:hypothetical protein